MKYRREYDIIAVKSFKMIRVILQNILLIYLKKENYKMTVLTFIYDLMFQNNHGRNS